MTERSNANAVHTAAQARAFTAWQDYIQKHSPQPVQYDSKLEHLAAVTLGSGPGTVAQFGVDAGLSLRMLSACRPRQQVMGFDAWHLKGPGLPDRWTGNFDHSRSFTWTQEAYTEMALSMPDNVRLVPGLFEQQQIRDVMGTSPASVIHIDCDTGPATSTVLEAIRPNLVVGTMIVFDEYANYPGWREHEHGAWTRFAGQNSVQAQYWGICHMDVSVRITSMGRNA